jgi:hypothetical protein
MFLEPKPAYLPISFLRHICPVKTYNKWHIISVSSFRDEYPWSQFLKTCI